MPPRVRYNEAMIVDAALSLARAGGLSAVSARSVAAELGCSTGPIFSNFDSMDLLHEALIDRIIALFLDAMRAASRAPGADPLIAAGAGMVRFAAEERRLYEALFLTHHPYHHKWGPVRRTIARQMAAYPRYQALDDRQRFGLVGRASVIAHGLGVEVWSRRLPAPDDATIQVLLAQIAMPVIDAALDNGWTQDIHSSPSLRTLS